MNYIHLIAFGITIGFLAACSQTPPQPPGDNLEIKSFIVSTDEEVIGTPISFSWQVESEAELSCSLDTDSDGQAEYNFVPCEAQGSQSHSFTKAGSYTVALDVAAGGNRVSKTLEINIIDASPDNSAPIANDDEVSAFNNSPVDIDVLVNDSDSDNDKLTIADVDTLSNEGAQVSVQGAVIRYTPKPGFTGSDSFSYRISDGRGGTDSAEVTIKVSEPEPSNQAPNLEPINDQTVIRNTITPNSVTIDLKIIDPDDDNFIVGLRSSDTDVLANSTHECKSKTCSLTLTPSADKTADITLELSLSDGRGGSAQASFVLKVIPQLVKVLGDTPQSPEPDSLREVVARSELGDVIGFDTDGIFKDPQMIFLETTLTLDKALTIEGPGIDMLVLRSTNLNDVRIITIEDATVIISDLALKFSTGGALFNLKGKLLLKRCDLSENRAHGGAGVSNVEGTVILEESRVTNNQTVPLAFAPKPSSLGAAIYNHDGTVYLNDSSLINNKANEGLGGAIYSEGGGIYVEKGVINKNQAQFGGAIYITSQQHFGSAFPAARLTILASSRIQENTAIEYGGGIYANGSTVDITLNDSQIQNNQAQSGGGIYNLNGKLGIENVNLANNVAKKDGGAIYNDNGEATFQGMIVQNRAENGGGIYSTSAEPQMPIFAILQDSRIEQNLATKTGGGIYNQMVVLVRGSSLISANQATAGGGVYNSGRFDIAGVSKAVVVENNAKEKAGGIWSIGLLGKGVNCETVKDNTPDDVLSGLITHTCKP